MIVTMIMCITAVSLSEQHCTYRQNDDDQKMQEVVNAAAQSASTSYFVVLVVCCSGSMLVSNDKVNIHRAGLVHGWATMSRFNSQCTTSVLVCNLSLIHI